MLDRDHTVTVTDFLDAPLLFYVQSLLAVSMLGQGARDAMKLVTDGTAPKSPSCGNSSAPTGRGGGDVGEESGPERRGSSCSTQSESDSSLSEDSLSENSDSDDDDPTYTPKKNCNPYMALPAMYMKKRKSNGSSSKKVKKSKKPLSEVVAKHLQEVIDGVARNVAPNVDIEVIELSEDEGTPDNPDDSVIHEFLELEGDHEEKPIVRHILAPDALTPKGDRPVNTSKAVQSDHGERRTSAASNGNVRKEVSVKAQPRKPTNSGQETVNAQHNLGSVMARVKAEPVDFGPTGTARLSPPSFDTSKELDDLRRENEVLRRDKAELEERLKRSDNKAKESRDECASLQQCLQTSEATTEAANKQVQELEAKLAKCNALITDLTMEARGLK